MRRVIPSSFTLKEMRNDRRISIVCHCTVNAVRIVG
jgi:hypothetical protein